jgi:hypothetical protein
MELVISDRLFDWSQVNPGVLTFQDWVGVNDVKFFKLVTEGMAGVDIGPVLPGGLTAEFLLADMRVDGSIKPMGKLTAAPGGGPYLYLVPVPEPSSTLLCGCGLLSLRRFRYRRV